MQLAGSRVSSDLSAIFAPMAAGHNKLQLAEEGLVEWLRRQGLDADLPDLPLERGPSSEEVPPKGHGSLLRRGFSSRLEDKTHQQEKEKLEKQVMAAYANELWRHVKDGNVAGFLTEVKRRPAVLHERGPMGETPLHMLVLYGHVDLACVVVMRYPSLLVDYYLEPLYQGETSLHIAIVLRNKGLVYYFLDKAAQAGLLSQLLAARATGIFFDRGQPCHFGESALGFAVSTNQFEVVRELVLRGASLEEADSYGNNVLHMTVEHKLPEMYDSILALWKQWAPKYAKQPDVPLMQRSNRDGLTPLCSAATYGYREIFNHMLESTLQLQWAFGPVTSSLLPLADLDYIPGTMSGAIEHIVREGHLDLIMLPLIQHLLQKKWEAFAKSSFTSRFWVALARASVFALMVIFPPPISTNDDEWTMEQWLFLAAHWCCKALVTCMTCGKLMVELREMWVEGLRGYFDFQGAAIYENFISILYCGSFVGSLALDSLDMDHMARPTLAISALLSWLYLLWFLLGFGKTGHLVVMIWKMLMGDMVQFGCLTSVFMIGFSLAFFIATTDPIERGPSTFGSKLFDCFHMMTSGFDKEERAGGTLLTTLLVLYSVLVTILLLNMLIAMMGDTYSKVSEAAQQQWLLERARIIITLEHERSAAERESEAGKYWVEIEGLRYMQIEDVSDTWGRAEVASADS